MQYYQVCSISKSGGDFHSRVSKIRPGIGDNSQFLHKYVNHLFTYLMNHNRKSGLLKSTTSGKESDIPLIAPVPGIPIAWPSQPGPKK